jgi:hypothetical protein
VLRHWVGLKESLQVYQQLIDDLWIQQTPEEFALTLAALLGRKRLLLHSEDDTVQPVECGYLVRFDTILNGEEISNKRTTSERIIMSPLRVLLALEDDSNELIQLLANMLDKGASSLESLDDGTVHYCAKKADGLGYSKAFQEAREELLNWTDAMQNADVQ